MRLFSLLDTQYTAFVSKIQNYLSKVLSSNSVSFGSNTIFGQITTVVANAIQNVMLYIEDALVEQNKYTAQRKKSIYGLDNNMNNIYILPFVKTTNIVGLSNFPFMEDDINRTCVILHIKPVTHILTLTIYWQCLTLTDVIDK